MDASERPRLGSSTSRASRSVGLQADVYPEGGALTLVGVDADAPQAVQAPTPSAAAISEMISA